MLRRLVAYALDMPLFVLVLAGAVVAFGLIAFHALEIEAYPNPVPPLVEVIAQPQGFGAEEVERYVAMPLEQALAGIPGLDHTRSQSLFGLADVKCYFRWGTPYEAARQEVINRLQFVTLPPGVAPSISPWNATGEIFRYVLRGRGYSLAELKAAQDWILERQLKQVDGVIDVTGFGGETRQYHIEIDPLRLRSCDVTLVQVLDAVANANINVGGQRLTLGEQSYTIRGIGLLASLADIERIVITQKKGTPVTVRDVGDVTLGAAPRLGIIGQGEEPDVVQGIVLMRYGGSTAKTLAGVRQRLERIQELRLLPPGMEVVPYYDRGDLVALTTHTVLENLTVGMLLVGLVLLLFLGNRRAALITAVNIPLALLIAFSGMVLTGTPANLISLGAVDFGIVVDSTVIMMENLFRRLGDGKAPARDRILAAAAEVGRPMAFSTLIIGAAFLPLFTLTGVSGVIFAPMAHTYALAIGGAIVLALTLTPVLAYLLFRGPVEERESFVMRALERLYAPAFAWSMRHPRVAVAGAILPVVALFALFPLLGGEFMPKLEEGNLWIRATLPPSVSLEQAAARVGRLRAIVASRPEVKTAVSQVGRPDDGTDVSGFDNIEIFAALLPASEWPHGMTKEKLTRELADKLEESFPGVVFAFSQAIADNVEEALSGVKGENSVKVVGRDLEGNAAVAGRIADTLTPIPGVHDLGVLPSLGQPTIRVVPDRALCARYGLNTGDVEAVVAAALGGQVVTQVYEGERHFDLTVRWRPEFRRDLEAIRELTVTSSDGCAVPLGEIAAIAVEDGPSVIYREDGERYTPVKFSVRGRDLASTVAQAQRKVAAKVRVPWGTHLDWVGQIDELTQTMGRLSVIIPLTLLLVALLVFAAVRSFVDTLIVIGSIPLACTGGVLALLISGLDFSVAAAMGFVSIFGIAIQDAILVITYAQRQWAEGKGLEEGARLAAERRFRPVLMTTLVATLGLLPAALSDGIGAQAQKPLAVVVIGGSLFLAGLIRVLQPPVLVMAHRWLRERGPTSGRAPDEAA